MGTKESLDKIIDKLDSKNLPPLGVGLCLLGVGITYFGYNQFMEYINTQDSRALSFGMLWFTSYIPTFWFGGAIIRDNYKLNKEKRAKKLNL